MRDGRTGTTSTQWMDDHEEEEDTAHHLKHVKQKQIFTQGQDPLPCTWGGGILDRGHAYIYILRERER